MRAFRPAWLVFSLILISACAAAQQAPQRDPQAVSVLTQVLNAAGGVSTVAAIQDFSASGTITYNWAGQAVQGPVTIYGKGLDQFRLDANMPAGTVTWVLNRTAGKLTTPDGQSASPPAYNLMTAGSLTLPIARIAKVLSDTAASLEYLGVVDREGLGLHRIRVIVPVNPPIAASGVLRELGTFDLYVDPGSYQLVALSESIWSRGNLAQPHVHEINFSNYAAKGSVLVPLTISESVGGARTWSMTLTSVSFNTGVSDSLFLQ